MRPTARLTTVAGMAAGIALFLAACSSSASTAPPTDSVAGATSMTGTSMPPASASVTLGSTTDQTLGAYLTGPSGMTLYILTTDTPDTSSCSGSCATSWPPLTAAPGAAITGPATATGMFATITRADGIVQVTYNHQPLYYFAGDSAAGQTTGQGKSGVWFVAPLTAGASAAPSVGPSATSSSSAYSGY